jgi:hypothetical protein
MTVPEIITNSNERALDVVTSVQKQIVDGAKTLVANVERITPDSDVLPDLPSAKDLLDEAYGFQTRLLKANHDFSVALANVFADAWSAVPVPAAGVSASTKPANAVRK